MVHIIKVILQKKIIRLVYGGNLVKLVVFFIARFPYLQSWFLHHSFHFHSQSHHVRFSFRVELKTIRMVAKGSTALEKKLNQVFVNPSIYIAICFCLKMQLVALRHSQFSAIRILFVATSLRLLSRTHLFNILLMLSLLLTWATSADLPLNTFCWIWLLLLLLLLLLLQLNLSHRLLLRTGQMCGLETKISRHHARTWTRIWRTCQRWNLNIITN